MEEPSPVVGEPLEPLALLRPRRRIWGASAVLLPLSEGGDIAWPAFRAHVARTAAAGLVPAVNMDTGYVHLLDEATRQEVLRQTRQVLAGQPFLAGAFVADQPGARFDRQAYLRQMEQIHRAGGTPVLFPSYGLTRQADADILAAYAALEAASDGFYAFELGPQFAPFGAIYSLEVFRGLLALRRCLGLKHSSLRRSLEWQRLLLRDALRPDFRLLTGNDLAIDMVMYGSDYLLGLSTFAPDLFAQRDAYWAAGDVAFYELNDLLQYLGQLAFRPPVPAYRHSAAQFLYLRGWLDSARPWPGTPSRPDSDLALLRDIGERLGLSLRPGD
jgi:dihydrodipicolinate synthase/N-acetylneuraminate lyase